MEQLLVDCLREGGIPHDSHGPFSFGDGWTAWETESGVELALYGLGPDEAASIVSEYLDMIESSYVEGDDDDE